MECSIATELSKLTKNQLVEFIVYNKLPLEKLKENNVLLNYEVSLKSKDEEQAVVDTSARGLENELLDCLRQQIANLNELVRDKNRIINLLNEKVELNLRSSATSVTTGVLNAPTMVSPVNAANITLNDNNKTRPISRSYVSACLKQNNVAKYLSSQQHGKSINAGDTKSKIMESTELDNGKNDAVLEFEEVGEGFKKVSYKKQKRPITIGSNTDEITCEFANTTKPKLWLFISRCKQHVTEKMIMDYTTAKTNSSDISVKLLETRPMHNNKKSFMVGFNAEERDKVYTNSFWPAGVRFERFDFYRGGHFLRNNAQNTSTTI